jgi:release factor glutamine methyltransferase
LGLDITFEQRDILKATPEPHQFDLIVSNPPYVCEEERAEMEHHVLDYEPEMALFVPDNHPLLFYEAITTYAATALTNGGMLAFETNRRFAHEVGALMDDAGFSNIKLKRDMFNNERIVIGCLRKE